MTPLNFYLNGFPLMVTLVYLALKLTLLRRTGTSAEDDQAWAWFANYALANLFFVWSWDYVHSWRTEVLFLSTGTVAVCSLGQAVAALRGLRKFPKHWTARLCLGVLFFVNLPITVLTI